MMKIENLILIGAFGLGAWLLLKPKKPPYLYQRPGYPDNLSPIPTLPYTQSYERPSTIQNQALPGQPGWGWTYYTDGTAIDPQGCYYKDGAQVWCPPA